MLHRLLRMQTRVKDRNMCAVRRCRQGHCQHRGPCSHQTDSAPSAKPDCITTTPLTPSPRTAGRLRTGWDSHPNRINSQKTPYRSQRGDWETAVRKNYTQPTHLAPGYIDHKPPARSFSSRDRWFILPIRRQSTFFRNRCLVSGNFMSTRPPGRNDTFQPQYPANRTLLHETVGPYGGAKIQTCFASFFSILGTRSFATANFCLTLRMRSRRWGSSRRRMASP